MSSLGLGERGGKVRLSLKMVAGGMTVFQNVFGTFLGDLELRENEILREGLLTKRPTQLRVCVGCVHGPGFPLSVCVLGLLTNMYL